MTMYVAIPSNAMAHDFPHSSDWDMPMDFKSASDMYRKEDAHAAHGCDAIYCQDLSEEAAFYGSVDSAADNESFPFPVVDFSSSECATPTPIPEHLSDAPVGQLPAGQYDYSHPQQAANRACGEAMQVLPPAASNWRVDNSNKAAAEASFTDCNNPYAKPRITFRNGGPSPRAVRPVAQLQQLAPSEPIACSGTHQQHPHSAPAAARPRAKPASRQVVPNKMAKVCFYELCPSPMQSNKWRTVTEGTAAGGQNWDPLVGKMLCDSCYSTFRKHGTLVRSVRTAEGWARLDNEGTVHRASHPKSGRAKRPSPSAQVSSAEGSPKQRKRVAYLDVHAQAAGAADRADGYGRTSGHALLQIDALEQNAYSEGQHDEVKEERHDEHDDFCALACSAQEQWHPSMGADESVAAF